MAEIVLVHGIAQEQRSAADLEAEWIPRLIGGVENAGHAAIGNQLRKGEITVRMAFYGNLFLPPASQARSAPPADSLSCDERFDIDFGTELVANALESPIAADAGEALRIKTSLEAVAEDEQGFRRGARALVARLDRLPWFYRVGLTAIARVRPTFAQAQQYLTDQATRDYAIGQVEQHLGPETRAVVGHSLGSVVAYDAARATRHRIPLLLTLGSPLGLTTVNQRLVPQPLEYPGSVKRWVNIASRDDIVAARLDLDQIFSGGRPAGAVLESTWLVDNGSSPHSAEFYLTKQVCGAALSTVLDQRAG